jgi:transcriptional regulator with XRE-family HTH domain
MLNASLITLDGLVTASDRDFYRALGQRLAEARKAAGLTQTQLAEQLDIAQQTLAHYELGRLRIAVALLPPVVKILGITVEELMGEQVPPAKRGPAPKLQQQIERIQQLPRTQQRFVMQMLDTVLQQAAR